MMAGNPDDEVGAVMSSLVVAARRVQGHLVGLRRLSATLTALNVALEVRGTIVMMDTHELLRGVTERNEKTRWQGEECNSHNKQIDT